MMTVPVPSASSSPSRSIPINTNNDQSRLVARADEAFQREAAMADYVDFCFATRLVHGMQKKQSKTHDISLRYENQALIDHIIATRQNRDNVFLTSTGSRSRAPQERRDSNEMLRNNVSYDERLLSHQRGDDWEEDMIFDMEL